MQRGVSERVLGTTKKYAKQVAQPEIHVPLPRRLLVSLESYGTLANLLGRDETGAKALPLLLSMPQIAAKQ